MQTRTILMNLIRVSLLIASICLILLCAGCGLINNNLSQMRDHLIEGLDLQARRDYVGAFESYKKASELVPSNPVAYLNTGNIFADLLVWDRAIELYKKAIELEPRYAKAYLNLGYAYHQDGQSILAVEMYEKAIKLKPQDDMAYNNRGIISLEEGNYDRAALDFDTAISLDPENALAYMNRGRVYHAGGSYERAVEYYSEALALDGACPLAGTGKSLAIARKPLGKEGSPVRHVPPPRKPWDIGAMDPLKPDVLAADATRKLNNNDYKAAIDECTLAISLDPGNASAYLSRGAALIITNQSTSDPGFHMGVDDLQKCDQLHPECVFVHMYLCDAYLRMGRVKEALDSGEKFLKRATPDVDAACVKLVKSFLRDANSRLKERQEAIRRGDIQIMTPSKTRPGR